MNDALVYAAAIIFFISVFPLHVFNYAYVSTTNKYASVNVSLYRFIRILNVNSEEGLKKMRSGDKKDRDKMKSVASNWLTIYNNLCITKIVQLGEYGILNQNNAYIALAQNAATNALYAFVRINGGKTKLRNYTVFNYEHSDINYYLKLVGVINLITLAKLFTIYLWGKINER